MATAHFEPGTSLDNRVEDFLDDKLQSTADLENLDELLANVELQRSQLQSQLDDAVRELDEARRRADDQQGYLQQRIDDFQALQDSIDRREAIAAASDAPDQAIARLQEPMRRLRAVGLAQRYLRLVDDVEALRVEARSHLPDSPKAALEPYTKLKRLAGGLGELQGEEKLHLVDYVAAVAEALWDEMKKTMSDEFEAILEKHKWPRVDPKSQMDDEWIAAFEKLIDLQVPEVLYSNEPVVLLPIGVMTQIIATEFRFHFLSDKPTSEPQAVGTHCFPWVLMTIEKWEDFLRDNLMHLLVAKFRDTDVAYNLLYVDPVCAFITALLPVLREKVHDVAQRTSKSPSALSAFIAQLMTFDEDIRSKFYYDGGNPEHGWDGLTTEVLELYFEDWFSAERKFAMDRFSTILESPDGRTIDYEYAADGRMKPTYAAVRITDLLRTVTTVYYRVRKVKHKIRFLINIQIEILEAYAERLSDSLQAYQSATSTIARTLHGASKEALAALEGTGALETLCKVLGSADHVVSTLTDWGDDIFFLVLWEQLEASPSTGSKRASTGPMSFDEVKEKTSSAMGQYKGTGALFDEMIEAYSRRQDAAQNLLILALENSHNDSFRNYTHHAKFTTVGDMSTIEDDPWQLTISPELDEPLHILTRNLEFLTKPLSTIVFRRVFRLALGKLQDKLWNEVLMRQKFTAYGATQFLRDNQAILSVIDRFIPGGSVIMARLRAGVQLLNLPLEVSEEAVASGKSAGITLQEADSRVYTDNEEARKLLEELQLTSLTTQNARDIMQRRVENDESYNGRDR